MSEFWENYSKPEWQKKRLEVMQAAAFACQECFTEDKMLTVHHTFYVRGRKPWEYPTDTLQCLCKDCHEKRTHAVAELKLMIGQLEELDLHRLTGYVKGLIAGTWKFASDESRIKVNSGEECHGLADAFGVHWMTANKIVAALDTNNSISPEEIKAALGVNQNTTEAK